MDWRVLRVGPISTIVLPLNGANLDDRTHAGSKLVRGFPRPRSGKAMTTTPTAGSERSDGAGLGRVTAAGDPNRRAC